jgi:hypothetical protein
MRLPRGEIAQHEWTIVQDAQLAGDNGQLAARVAGRKTWVAFRVFMDMVMSTILMGFVKVPVNF